MSSDGLPSQQTDPARSAVYIWHHIAPRSNRLIRDKLLIEGHQLREDIKKTRAEIRFANRLNFNKTGVEITIARVWEQKVDEHAGKCYEIFCRHWILLGETKTGAFVRVVSGILLSHITLLVRSAAHAAKQAHRGQGSIGTSAADSYDTFGRAVSDRWKTKLDIEARELDLVASVEGRQERTDPSLPCTGQGRNPAAVTSSVDPVAIVRPGEIVVESGSLSPGRVRRKKTRNKRAAFVARIKGTMANSTFWRDLAVQFLALQDNARLRVGAANHFMYSALEALAIRGASEIAGAGAPDLLAVWLEALRKEGLVFRSSGQSNDVSATEYAHSIIKGTFDGICEASATLCKRLEAQAVQAEFEEQGGPTSRRQRPPIAKRGPGATRTKKSSFYTKDRSYQTIVFCGREYNLTPQAGAILKVLHESGGKPVAKADIQSKTTCGKIADSFRRLDGPQVWKKLIEVTKGRKGFYSLRLQALSHSQ
jgi:hypothetical protein